MSGAKHYLRSPFALNRVFVLCKNGHVAVVRLLIEKYNTDTRRTDRQGHTPVYVAAQNGILDVVRFLVDDCDVDVNQPSFTSPVATPIMAACYNGHEDVVEYLVGWCPCALLLH